MAKPTTARFGKFFVRLSDGGNPAQYIAPCGFTSKAYNQSNNLGETNIPDCDNPDAPGYVERDVISMSDSISGEGVLAAASVPIWEAARKKSTSCEIEFLYEDGSSDVYLGNFVLESFNRSGNQGERVQVSISMQSDGPITHTHGSGS